jgi:hypothetical protein
VKRIFLLTLLVFQFSAAAWGQTAPTKLRFGIYAPNASFASNSDRWSYIKNVASVMQSTLKIPCTGNAYAAEGAFSGATGQLDFALVDGIYLARGGKFRVLATSLYGGGSRSPWGLYAKAGGNFQSLKGKVLVMPSFGGNTSFAEGMLGGEINVTQFFSSVKNVPDIAAAVSAVQTGGGDAVFAPVGLAAGLNLIFSVGTVPNASFVLVNSKIPADIVAKVQAAIASVGSGAIGGMGPAAAGGVAMGRSTAKFLSSQPGVMRFQFRGFLKPFEGTYQESPLVDHFWVLPKQ